MDSIGNRRRQTRSDIGMNDRVIQTDKDDQKPPIFIIDLSLPPVRRYQHVATHFKSDIAALPMLFDDLVRALVPNVSLKKVKKLARLLLRKLHSAEQTEEVKGIQQVTGVDMYLLVAFNVLLELLLGCTSGGARTRDQDGETRMLHFRTLDCSMDALRKIVVQLDFIRMPGGGVIASSITYAGFVGVLTGVREDLSMSLNFRPVHAASGRSTSFRFYWHYLLVLFDIRSSVASTFRQLLLPPQKHGVYAFRNETTLQEVENKIRSTASTAAYLVFSNGDRTIMMEKDHHEVLVRSSENFIVVTNHDQSKDSLSTAHETTTSMAAQTSRATGMDGLLKDSIERKTCMINVWENNSGSQMNTSNEVDESPEGPVAGSWLSFTKGISSIREETLSRWMQMYPISNEETHFAAVMDPKAGKVLWTKRYLEPFRED